MAFCRKCGSQVADNSAFCNNCGTPAQETTPVATTHDIPKCQHCGHVGPWKIAPILRPVDIIIGIILLFLGVVPGIIYLGVVAAIRSNKDRRSKSCTKCGAKNLFTFIY